MTSLPSRIIIKDGRLKMKDGSSLRAYLDDFQKRNKVSDGAFVNIFDHASLDAAHWKRIIDDELLLSA